MCRQTPGIVNHWETSTHAEKGVACVECHQAAEEDADAYTHYGVTIATVVTPRDCSRCHTTEGQQFAASHHAKAGNILASLDNFLAETVEGARQPFNPHSPTRAKRLTWSTVSPAPFPAASSATAPRSRYSRPTAARSPWTTSSPTPNGVPTNLDAVSKIVQATTTAGHYSTPEPGPTPASVRINLDGSRGSCSACHSRHDFSPRRARQPENCGKCHLGPDHPQKEIFEESKHGVAYRDLKDDMNLDATDWVLGEDYSAAPTCATCHMSGHLRNGGEVTHDPGERISWTNRPPVSLVMDTDINHAIVKETDPDKRRALIHDSAANKRERMQQVCSHCHTPDYINAFYTQYDDFVILYNEKFAKPGKKIMARTWPTRG